MKSLRLFISSDLESEQSRTWMAKLLISVTLLVLTAVVVFRSQDEAKFKMPCAEVVKLGLDKFMDLYGEKTNDYSTTGMKYGFGYYVGCKRAVNNDHAAKLSAERRQQINLIRDTLVDIGSASWSNAYIEAGGGTMYGLANASAFAVREDLMGSVIAAMTMSSDTRARRRAHLALRRARRALPPADGVVELKHWDEASRAEKLKLYRENVHTIRNGFSILEALIRSLCDRAADIVAHRLEDEISADLQE